MAEASKDQAAMKAHLDEIDEDLLSEKGKIVRCASVGAWEAYMRFLKPQDADYWRLMHIIDYIEKGEFDHFGTPRIAASTRQQNKKHTFTAGKNPNQLTLFASDNDPIREKLETIKPDTLAPLEALNLLYELKKLSEE